MKKIIQHVMTVSLAMIFAMAFAAEKYNRQEKNACVRTNAVSNAADYNSSEGKMVLTDMDPVFY